MIAERHNYALQRTGHDAVVGNHCVPCAGSLSLVVRSHEPRLPRHNRWPVPCRGAARIGCFSAC